MQIVRFEYEDRVEIGAIENGIVRRARGSTFDGLSVGPEVAPVEDVRLLAPVIPSKLIAIGLNYKDHIEEDTAGMDVPENPIIFLKPPSSIIGPDAPIILPKGAENVDAEAELAIVIGQRCRHVPAERAYDVILGFACSNDVSARDYQFKDGQWSRAKGFDTFSPLGPAIVTDVRADDLAITSRVNGKTFQSSSTRHLLFDVPYLIEFISRVMTLEPGDVIMTGTPAGPPHLEPGDVCEIEVEQLGVLRNPVEAEQ